MAKVIIDVLAKDLCSVLKDLELTPEFAENVKCTLELIITDSKKNFENLVKSNKVLDWDFILESDVEDITDPIEDFSPKPSSIKSGLFDDNPRALEIYAYFDHPNFWEDKEGILKLIFLAWNIKYKSPERLFSLCSLSSTKHLESHTIKLGNLADYYSNTLNNRLINYYKDISYSDVLEDVIYKLHKIWNKLNEIHEFNNVIDEFLKY